MAQVSRAASYQWQEGRGSAGQGADAALLAAIRAIHAASGGQYGVPRVLAELRAQGYDVGRKRVARLMGRGRAAGPPAAALGADDHAGADPAGDPGSGAWAIHGGRARRAVGRGHHVRAHV
jgi:hypothetical protein